MIIKSEKYKATSNNKEKVQLKMLYVKVTILYKSVSFV